MDLKSIYISKIWDELAADFDTYKPSIWQLCGNRLIDVSNISKGNRVLDIGCGKGNTLVTISKIIGPKGKATGIDLSIPMVNFSNKLIKESNITNVEVLHQDVSHINNNFSSNYFDNIIGNFSFRYVLQTRKVLNDVIDKLKTGGTLSFTLWGQSIHDAELDTLISKYVKLYNPLADKLSDNNIEYIKTDNDIKQRLNGTNLSSISIFTEDRKIIFENAEVFIRQQWNNLYRADLKEILLLGEDVFNEFYKEFVTHFEKNRIEGGIEINYKVMYGVCQK